MRQLKVLASVIALVIAAAACGGDDSADDNDVDANGVEETETESPGADNGDDNGDDNGTDEEAAPSGDYADFCATAEDMEEADPPEDPESELEDFRVIVDAAPSEIQDDMATMADVIEELYEIEQEGDPQESMEASLELMNDPEFVEAMQNIDDFLVAECGFEPTDFEGGGPPDDFDPDELTDDALDSLDDMSDEN